MPKVTWDELHKIRHSLSYNIDHLHKLEHQMRDFYRTSNKEFCIEECLKTIDSLKLKLTMGVADIDTLTLKHEDE
jgi:hypothetical protein